MSDKKAKDFSFTKDSTFPKEFTFPFGSPESAQQVWLAGLGALTRAQQEGGKVFDALVQEGLAMQRRIQNNAEARLVEAGEKMSNLAQELSQRAGGQWDKLENLFEERVARTLQRLGIPTTQEVQALRERVAALEEQLAAGASGKTNAARQSAQAADDTLGTTAKTASPARTRRS